MLLKALRCPPLGNRLTLDQCMKWSGRRRKHTEECKAREQSASGSFELQVGRSFLKHGSQTNQVKFPLRMHGAPEDWFTVDSGSLAACRRARSSWDDQPLTVINHVSHLRWRRDIRLYFYNAPRWVVKNPEEIVRIVSSKILDRYCARLRMR